MNFVKSHLPTLSLCLAALVFLTSFSSPNHSFSTNFDKAQVKRMTDSLKTASLNNHTFIDKLYDSVQLGEAGLSREAFRYAMRGYQNMRAQHQLHNEQYLTIVDFSKSSREKRFFLIDVKNYKLVLNTFVAHGRNTGVDMATRFSNQPESNQSSLGFYVTKGVYTGKHGMSLKIAGMDQGFNDKAEARAIVVHGADYVNAGRVNSDYMGRSQGCPALPQEVCPQVINMIKDGSAMFLYYPSNDYLKGSTILNSAAIG